VLHFLCGNKVINKNIINKLKLCNLFSVFVVVQLSDANLVTRRTLDVGVTVSEEQVK
jgi:hypothetical protein